MQECWGLRTDAQLSRYHLVQSQKLSSFESEWYSASICGCEVTVVQGLLEEIGFVQASPTRIMEDNAACFYLSIDAKPMNPRSKHIDTQVFKLKEFAKDWIMILTKIDSENQVADDYTTTVGRCQIGL